MTERVRSFISDLEVLVFSANLHLKRNIRKRALLGVSFLLLGFCFLHSCTVERNINITELGN